MAERFEDDLDQFLVAFVQTVMDLALLALKFGWGVLVTVARIPVPAVLLGGLVAGELAWGWVAPTLTVLGLGAALVAWRVWSPSTFRRWAQWPALALWRMVVVYRPRWRHVAARHGLVARAYRTDDPTSRQPDTAKLIKVRSAPGLDRLLIRLPVGMAPLDVEKVCDGLAHAFRARECRVSADRPGRIWLEVHRRDVLEAVVQPLSVQGSVDLGAVPLGVHEDGSLWRLRLRGTHVLVAGATGAGKGSVLWSLLHALGPAICEGWVHVWAIDPKGGMELRPGRPMFQRFADSDAESMCQLLEELVALKDSRAKALAVAGMRTHVASVEDPHVVVVIDELATLTAFAERGVTHRVDKALGLLLTQGRACGITVLAAVQDPGKDVVGWRDLFPTRVAMRVDNPIQVDMVLGEGATDRGARADQISELTPGVAFVRVEGTRRLRRVRAAYLADADVVHLAATYPAHRGSEDTFPEGDEVA